MEGFHPPPKETLNFHSLELGLLVVVVVVVLVVLVVVVVVVVVVYPGDQDQLEALRLLDLGQETLGSKGSNDLGILKAGDS